MRSSVFLPAVGLMLMVQAVDAIPTVGKAGHLRSAPSLVPPSSSRPSSTASMTSPNQQQLLHLGGLGECSNNDAQLRLRGGTAPAKDDGKFWRNLWRTAVIAGLSGGAAGLGCDFILWPIETVKTRVQAGKPHGVDISTPIQSLTTLFDGCHVSLIFGPIFWGMFFFAYEPSKEALLHMYGSGFKNLIFLASTTLAVWFSFIVRVPVEIIKTRMMTGADKGMVEGFKHIYDHEGVKGFYSGWWSLSFRELPFSLIEMMLYENVRAMWAKYTGKGDAAISLLENCVIGSLVDGCTAWATNPFDVIKSRLMNQVGEAGSHTMLDIVSGILKERGLIGMMDGASVRYLWMAVGGFIFWPILEAVQNILNAWWPEGN